MRRPEQLAQELRDQMRELLAQRVEFPEGMLVTVTRADLAAKGHTATFHLSVMPPQRGPEALRLLQEHLYELQGVVYERVDRHPAPRIRFSLEPGVPSDASR